MKEVLVYTSGACPYCMRAKNLLAAKGVIPEERRVDIYPEYMEEAVRRSGGRQTVPQIFIGEYHIGGFDDMKALDDNGELDTLLQG